MKLKSLLLGSAAVLALSTGAQAADPIVEFVSLGVCDTYGITGLTIESDGTCLSISGEVEYEYEVSHDDNAGATAYSSAVDWELAFEATTQTDAGAAVAKITFVDAAVATGAPAGVIDGVEVDEAYVRFGDTTVLSAGKKGSIFDRELVDDLFTVNDEEAGNSWYTVNIVATGGHVIQIESLVADGFTVLASLEDLNGNGTAGLGIKYDNAGIAGEAGVLIGDLEGNIGGDQINYYAKVNAEFEAFAVNAGFLANDNGEWVATVGAEATLDMFSLDVEAYFEDEDQFGIAGNASFDATETIAVYLGAQYEEIQATGGISALYERWTVSGGVNVDVTDTIAVNGEIGYVEDARPQLILTDEGDDFLYGLASVTYAPGGGFETSLEGEVRDNGDYIVTFNASKEF